MNTTQVAALDLLEQHANEGDRIHHAWAYICRYCGECSDYRLEHTADCPFVQLQQAHQQNEES